jgi:hypothetical protein
MTCDRCGKEMPERIEKLNGHDIRWPICETCQAELDRKSDEYPKKHGKRK